jgi:hypothetical protein
MRLIDADELRKCAIPCEIHNGALTDLCVPLYQIDNAPTVSERPQGEWVGGDQITYYGGLTVSGCWHCSNCGALAGVENNFCGRCGAKMKGGKE